MTDAPRRWSDDDPIFLADIEHRQELREWDEQFTDETGKRHWYSLDFRPIDDPSQSITWISTTTHR